MPKPVGYSGKPIAVKLGLETGQCVALIHAPPDATQLLAPLPDGLRIVHRVTPDTNVALVFSRSARILERDFAPAAARLAPGGMLWVAWPKKTSGEKTDLSEDVVRRIGLAAGLVDVKVCAISDIWSGLKFLRRRRINAS